jgi:hypothetical protein
MQFFSANQFYKCSAEPILQIKRRTNFTNVALNKFCKVFFPANQFYKNSPQPILQSFFRRTNFTNVEQAQFYKCFSALEHSGDWILNPVQVLNLQLPSLLGLFLCSASSDFEIDTYKSRTFFLNFTLSFKSNQPGIKVHFRKIPYSLQLNLSYAFCFVTKLF